LVLRANPVFLILLPDLKKKAFFFKFFKKCVWLCLPSWPVLDYVKMSEAVFGLQKNASLEDPRLAHAIRIRASLLPEEKKAIMFSRRDFWFPFVCYVSEKQGLITKLQALLQRKFRKMISFFPVKNGFVWSFSPTVYCPL